MEVFERGNVKAVSYLKLISRGTVCPDTHLCERERERLFNERFILLLSVSFSLSVLEVLWGVIHLSHTLTSPFNLFYYKWLSQRKVWKWGLFHFLPLVVSSLLSVLEGERDSCMRETCWHWQKWPTHWKREVCFLWYLLNLSSLESENCFQMAALDVLFMVRKL